MDRILHMERLSRMGAQRCLQRDMRLLRVVPGGQTDAHLPRRELAAARVGRARAEMAPIPQSWGTQELAPLKGPCNWVARSSETHEWLGSWGSPYICFALTTGFGARREPVELRRQEISARAPCSYCALIEAAPIQLKVSSAGVFLFLFF